MSTRDDSLSRWSEIINIAEVEKILNSINGLDYTPTRENVLNAFRYTNPEDLKIIIIGQDPYPTRGDADGLCFSSNAKKVPASLKKILECAIDNTDISTINSYSLISWAIQGVLMLNSSLTTVVGESGSHKALWKNWIGDSIKSICRSKKNLVFMLWGNDARSLSNLMDGHTVYEWTHPSPICDNRLPEDEKFIRCDHFSNTNHLVRWNISDTVYAFSDGAAIKNGKPGARASYAAVLTGYLFSATKIYGEVKHHEYIDVDTVNAGVSIAPTNNRGELLGIINCLYACLICHIVGSIIIISDSNIYVKLLSSGYKKHVDNGTEGSLKNNDLLSIAWKIMGEIKGKVIIKFHPSHGTSPLDGSATSKLYFEGNKEADRLASLALADNAFQEKLLINAPRTLI